MILNFDIDENDELVYTMCLEEGQKIEICIHGNNKYILTEHAHFPFNDFEEFNCVFNSPLFLTNEDGDKLELSREDCEIISKIIKKE